MFRPLHFMFWLHSLASVFTGLEISRILPVTVSQLWTLRCSQPLWTPCCSLPMHPKIDNPHYAWGSSSLTDNIDARSCNHYCRGKTIIITYFECVCCSVSYPACKASAPYYIVICVLSGCTIFFHIISQTTRLSEKLLNTKCVFWFSLQLYLKHFSFQEEFSVIS